MKITHSFITENIISRLCHELAGPIGVVSNGIELANEIGGDIASEAMSMANISAVDLVSRIKFYRIAYGIITINFKDFTEFYNIANEFLYSKNTKLLWAVPEDNVKLSAAEYKLILNMIALVNMAIIKDGEIKVDIKNNNFNISALGGDFASIKNLVTGIDENISSELLTPHNIHGYWTAHLARQVERNLSYNIGVNKIIFTA